MAEVTATEVRRKLHSVLVSAQAGESTVITRHGKVLAVVVSAEDYKLFQTFKTATSAFKDQMEAGLSEPRVMLVPELVSLSHPTDANGTPVHD